MILQRRDLLEALSVLSRATGNRINGLDCVTCAPQDGVMVFTACNGQQWVDCAVEGDAVDAGFTVNCAMLHNMVRSLPDGEIHLKVEDPKLRVSQGVTSFNLPLAEVDFGIRGKADKITWTFKVEFGVLKSALQRVVHAMSKDTSRPNLCTVRFEYKNGVGSLTATDTHRLASESIVGECDSEAECLLPSWLVNLIPSLPIRDEETISLEYCESGYGRIILAHGGVKIESLSVGNTYPNWRRVIPGDGLEFRFNRLEMIEALNLAGAVLTKGDLPKVNLDFIGNTCDIWARAESSFDGKISCTGTDSLLLSVNPKFLLDALGSFDCEEVTLACQDSTRPMAIRPSEATAHTSVRVIMPMQREGKR